MKNKYDLTFLNADKVGRKAVVEIVTGKRFDSINDAARNFGISKNLIRKSCTKAVVIDPGFKFRYLD